MRKHNIYIVYAVETFARARKKEHCVLATESNGISLVNSMYRCVLAIAIAIALFMTLMSNDLMFRVE